MNSQTNRNNQTEISQYFDHMNKYKTKMYMFMWYYVTMVNINVIVKIVYKNHNYMVFIRRNIKKRHKKMDLENVITYKYDFYGYNSKTELHKNSQKPTISPVPFSGLSTYNNMYLNWGMGDTLQLLPQNNPTVFKEMLFMGRSYQGVQTPQAQSCKNMNKALKLIIQISIISFRFKVLC